MHIHAFGLAAMVQRVFCGRAGAIAISFRSLTLEKQLSLNYERDK